MKENEKKVLLIVKEAKTLVKNIDEIAIRSFSTHTIDFIK